MKKVKNKKQRRKMDYLFHLIKKMMMKNWIENLFYNQKKKKIIVLVKKKWYNIIYCHNLIKLIVKSIIIYFNFSF